MRTTVTLDDDVVAAIEQLRRERSLGLSAAVNELVRAGLIAGASAGRSSRPRPFRQRTHHMGAKLDVANIGQLLETIEGPEHR